MNVCRASDRHFSLPCSADVSSLLLQVSTEGSFTRTPSSAALISGEHVATTLRGDDAPSPSCAAAWHSSRDCEAAAGPFGLGDRTALCSAGWNPSTILCRHAEKASLNSLAISAFLNFAASFSALVSPSEKSQEVNQVQALSLLAIGCRLMSVVRK